MPPLTKRHAVFTLCLALTSAAFFLETSRVVPNGSVSRAATTHLVSRCGFIFNERFYDTIVIGTNGAVIIEFVTTPILPRSTGGICLLVDDQFTSDQIERSLLVETSDVEKISCTLHPTRFHVTLIRDQEVCFSFQNTAATSPSDKGTITDVGFTLGLGPFTLASIDPIPQPNNQELVFTTGLDAIPGTFPSSGSISFAVITGNRFVGGNPLTGVLSGEQSSVFCVNGPFPRMFASDFLLHTYIRFRGETARFYDTCRPDSAGGGFSLSLGSP